MPLNQGDWGCYFNCKKKAFSTTRQEFTSTAYYKVCLKNATCIQIVRTTHCTLLEQKEKCKFILTQPHEETEEVCLIRVLSLKSCGAWTYHHELASLPQSQHPILPKNNKDWRSTIEKISNFQQIAKNGFFSTPAVIIDGQIKCVGKVLSKKEALAWVLQ